MEQIHAAEMSEAIGIEFYLYFLSAVSHAMKAYIMDGFIANVIRLEKNIVYGRSGIFIPVSRRI